MYPGIEHDTQHGGPHIQDIDTPGAEAGGKNEGQRGHIVHLDLEAHKQGHTAHAHQAHVQEGSGQSAHGKIAGGRLAGAAHNSPQTAEHIRPVRHKYRCHQEKGSKYKKEYLQKISFRQGSFFLHSVSLLIIHRMGGRFPFIKKCLVLILYQKKHCFSMIICELPPIILSSLYPPY